MIDIKECMLDKDFMDIIYKADSGRMSNKFIARSKKIHNNIWDEELKKYFDILRNNLSLDDFEEFESFIETNYSEYIENGYKIGFNDGICFMLSVMSDYKNNDCDISG